MSASTVQLDPQQPQQTVWHRGVPKTQPQQNAQQQERSTSDVSSFEETEVAVLFEHFDVDADGEISKQDLREALQV